MADETEKKDAAAGPPAGSEGAAAASQPGSDGAAAGPPAGSDGAAAASPAAEPSEAKPPAKPPAKTGDVQEPASPAAGKSGDDSESSTEVAKKSAKSKRSRTVSSGVAHIKATFNNTMISITDMAGGVIAWSSAGRAGFKGSRKSTSFAATLVGQEAARRAVSVGMHEVEVRVQGAGAGRESAIRALQASGLNISVIKDVTPIPHNGCRARKRRRV